jgi:hypothetical protein
MRWALIAAALMSCAAAQRTWVVDAVAGAGADFTDIAPAVLAAADGDTVLVRRGTYTHFVVRGKSLRVMAVAGQRPWIRRATEWPPVERAVVEVRDLAEGQTVALRELQITSDDYQRGLWIRNCAGSVHLDDILVNDQGVELPLGGSVIESCRLVTLANGSLVGGRPALSAALSQLVVTGSHISGSSAMQLVGTSFWNAWPGLRLVRSTASLASTSVLGGDGLCSSHWGGIAPRAAIEASASNLTISGGAGTRCAAGRDVHPTRSRVPAIVGSSDSSIVADPKVAFGSVNGAEPITGSVKFRRVVCLKARVTAGGSALEGEIVSPAGDLVALLVGGPAAGTPTLIGDLFLDRWLVPVSGTQNEGERFVFRVKVPELPTLQRTPVALQAANLYAGNGALALSNPAIVTIFP